MIAKHYAPHEYQREAARFQLDRQLAGEPGAGFFLDPGLGKTSIAMMAFKALRVAGLARKALILAPKRVVNSVWKQEGAKWSQFRDLRIEICNGNPVQRIDRLRKKTTDVSVICTDSVDWLVRYWLGIAAEEKPTREICGLLRRMKLPEMAAEVSTCGVWPALTGWRDASGQKHRGLLPSRLFTFCKHLDLRIPAEYTDLIVDESSMYKSPASNRFHSLSAISGQFERVSILTGTPSPNGLVDLWSQIYLLDRGEALGSSFSRFKARYYQHSNDFRAKPILKPGAAEEIHEAISHLVIRLSADDHLDLPDLVVNDIWIDLPKRVQTKYKKLERDLFVELETSDGSVLFDNSCAKYCACRGFANGGIYETLEETDERLTHHFHEEKINPLKELIGELQGKPLMIAYPYQHDLERIKKHYPDIPAINGSTSDKEGDRLVDAWNAGDLPLLAVQPASLSHGVNMQSSGLDMCWFGLTDNLEHYLQLIRRIHRQGVRGQVRIHRILARHTVDEAVAERLDEKDGVQQSLLDALNNYRKREGLK